MSMNNISFGIWWKSLPIRIYNIFQTRVLGVYIYMLGVESLSGSTYCLQSTPNRIKQMFRHNFCRHLQCESFGRLTVNRYRVYNGFLFQTVAKCVRNVIVVCVAIMVGGDNSGGVKKLRLVVWFHFLINVFHVYFD